MEKLINEQLGYIRPGRVNGSIEMAGLFDKWYHRTAQLNKESPDEDGHYGLVCDGIMRKPGKDESGDVELERSWWSQPKRIAFLMKDQNQGSSHWSDDARNWLCKKKDMQELTNRTFRNIANILWGLIYSKEDICPHEELVEKFDEIRTCFHEVPFAYIETKKQGGGSMLHDKELALYLNDYKDLLYKELDILNPNVFVCTGSPIYGFVQEYILHKYKGEPQNTLTKVPSLKNVGKNEPSILLHIPSKTIILLGYHPSLQENFGGSMENIYMSVMDHYQAFLHSKYYEFFK